MSRVDNRSWREPPRTQPAICAHASGVLSSEGSLGTTPLPEAPGHAWPGVGGSPLPPLWGAAVCAHGCLQGGAEEQRCILRPGPGGGGRTACAPRRSTAPCPAQGDGGQPPWGPSVSLAARSSSLTCPPAPRATPSGARGRISVSALGLGLAGHHFPQPPSGQPDTRRVS